MARSRSTPDATSHLYGTTGGESWDEEWPAAVQPSAMSSRPTLEPEHLKAVWRGDAEDSYPQLALIATMALALRGLGTTRGSRRSNWHSNTGMHGTNRFNRSFIRQSFALLVRTHGL